MKRDVKFYSTGKSKYFVEKKAVSNSCKWVSRERCTATNALSTPLNTAPLILLQRRKNYRFLHIFTSLVLIDNINKFL